MTYKTGDMVALKGHHAFPMVVLRLTFSEGARIYNTHITQARLNRDRMKHVGVKLDPRYEIQPSAEDADREPVSEDIAAVAWLDRHGAPHEKTYPTALLEAIDG